MFFCFCGMVDRRKAFSPISSRDHCQGSTSAASRVWACAEPEFRLSWMKLCSSDNHYTTAPHNITLNQCAKGCTIFQRPCRLVRLKNLTFTPQISKEIFFKVLFLPPEIFSYLRFATLLCCLKCSNAGNAVWKCI